MKMIRDSFMNPNTKNLKHSMNKYELACLVAKDTKKPLADVIPIVNSMVTIMADTILAQEQITFTQLGSFCLKPRSPRKGYDPYRKVPITIPGGMRLEFRVSPTMRTQIKERYSHKITPELVAEMAEP